MIGKAGKREGQGEMATAVQERRGDHPQLFLRDVCGAERTFWWVDLVINQTTASN